MRLFISRCVSFALCVALAAALIAGTPSHAQETPALPAAEAPAAPEPTFTQRVDDFLKPFNNWWAETINKPLDRVLFYPIYTTGETYKNESPVGLPLIVVTLLFGGVFFTIRYGFLNIRMFRHAFHLVLGKYDKKDDPGEVSHFQALSSALAGTVGLGNIAGVAVAITLGGPGAVFWMWFTAFFGMSMKCSECLLAHMYRRVNADGRVLGGPMIYLEEGLKQAGIGPIGKVMAVIYALFAIMSAFAAGNMFQVNQTVSIFSMSFFPESGSPLALKLGMGIVIAIMTALVIIGGIKRIGEFTSRLVPFMCGMYILMCLYILALNLPAVPGMFISIFQGAFGPDALFGGFIGVLVQGTRRAAFSNEAGLGSAAIAHSAAKTDEPVREGYVALLEPFIDTIVVCTMTALAILTTGAHETGTAEGVGIARLAFKQLGGIEDFLLCLAVFTFAWSTVLGWGYYGERATEYLFGTRGIKPYRILYVLVICVAPLLSLGAVIDFADMLLLSLAFPNILGMIILSGKVKAQSDDYIRRFRAGEMKMTR
jgi:AGCS family alanine or glycine:cation symporter